MLSGHGISRARTCGLAKASDTSEARPVLRIATNKNNVRTKGAIVTDEPVHENRTTTMVSRIVGSVYVDFKGAHAHVLPTTTNDLPRDPKHEYGPGGARNSKIRWT